ncbi:MAG: Mrp/NBP35 family ATP-binding protein [Flavobacteriales bacterium]|jgi:ATP-binding protein involved in chromosome partitioning|tara:strand:- start:35776 stop:36900 length:1125 start_codon:yes stop_codon:yes gene_type:complete
MKITKEQVLEALSTFTLPGGGGNLVSTDSVRNIQIFGTEIVLDVEINNPTLQYKKKVEVDCLKAIHDHVYEKADIKVNLIINAPEKPSNVIRGNEIPGVKNIIAVASGKGGVGKSTITANLAVALADKGYKVGLVDADIYGPSMPLMFDVVNAKPSGREVDGKRKILPVQSYGVKLLSIGFFANTDQAVVWRGAMASKALNQMLWDTDWGQLDFLLVDLPPGTGDIHLSLVQAIPVTASIMVSTPQAIALADAKKGVAMFQMESINVPVLGIVENMSYFTPEDLPNNKYYIFGKDGAKELAKKLKLPLLAEIPLVQSVREAGDVGRPAVLQGATDIANSFVQLAENVVLEMNERNKLEPTKRVEITTMSGCSTK